MPTFLSPGARVDAMHVRITFMEGPAHATHNCNLLRLLTRILSVILFILPSNLASRMITWVMEEEDNSWRKIAVI